MKVWEAFEARYLFDGSLLNEHKYSAKGHLSEIVYFFGPAPEILVSRQVVKYLDSEGKLPPPTLYQVFQLTYVQEGSMGSQNHQDVIGKTTRRTCRETSKRNSSTSSLTCYSGSQKIDLRRRKPLGIDGWQLEPLKIPSLGRHYSNNLTTYERFRVREDGL